MFHNMFRVPSSAESISGCIKRLLSLSPFRPSSTTVMSETPTLYKSSIDELEVVAAEFERYLNTFSPDFLTTPTSVYGSAEVKPVPWDGPHDPRDP
jgi:hypothetical protein